MRGCRLARARSALHRSLIAVSLAADCNFTDESGRPRSSGPDGQTRIAGRPQGFASTDRPAFAGRGLGPPVAALAGGRDADAAVQGVCDAGNTQPARRERPVRAHAIADCALITAEPGLRSRSAGSTSISCQVQSRTPSSTPMAISWPKSGIRDAWGGAHHGRKACGFYAAWSGIIEAPSRALEHILSDDQLEDQLIACTVEMREANRTSTGFFISRSVLLADLYRFWDEFDPVPNPTIRTSQDQILTATRIDPVPVWDMHPDQRAIDDPFVQAVTVEESDHHPQLDLEFTDLQGGDPILIAKPSRVIKGRATGVREHDAPYNGAPYDLASLGVAVDQLSPEFSGAPVMNCRTGRVCGIVLYGWHGTAHEYKFVPLGQLERQLDPYLKIQQASTSGWRTREPGTGRTTSSAPDQGHLLFRLYIPSMRLYAAEATRLLSLFREWLTAARGYGVRQEGYRTAAGEMIEFFVEIGAASPGLQDQFDNFSSFLTLCAADRTTALSLLADTSLDRAAGVDLVDRFAREVNRLEMDMRYERRRRMLSLQQSLEEEFLNNDVDLALPSITQLEAMIGRLVPGPAAAAPLALLATPLAQSGAQLNLQINQQFITAVEGTVINSVVGTVNLAPQAKELLTLIQGFGGDDAATLQSAVYEFEDPDAPKGLRSAAKRRLKQFLGQVTDVAKDVGAELLSKYLESKGL